MAPKEKGFAIIHLNIRSILRHLDELILQLQGHKIIGISETWLTERVDDRILHFPGYSIIRQDRVAIPPKTKPKKGGGLLLYIIEELEAYVEVLEPHCHCTVYSEELWIKITPPGQKHMILGLIYRPPSGNIDSFMHNFNNTALKLLGIGNPCSRECYIIGDMNIDYLQPSTLNTKKLKELEFRYNLRQIILTPTRTTSKSKSIIDLIFTTVSKDLIVSSGVDYNISISDHVPVYIIKKKTREHHPKGKILVRKKALYNPDYYKNLLLADPAWQAYWCNNLKVNESWTVFVEIMTRCLDILCPLKWITIRNDQPNWFDGELRKAIDNKARLFKTARTSKSEDDWKSYTNMKKQVRSLIIHKKRHYILTKIQENRNAPKKFWKEIQNNLSFGRLKSRNKTLTIYAPNKTLLTGEAAANEMNEYYINVGRNLAEKFTVAWCSDTVRNIQSPSTVHFRIIGEREMISLVKFLKLNKSSRITNISMIHLRDALLSLIPEMVYLVNECLRTCTMPHTWKIGHITPIPKSGASFYTINYRPISVLPAPSKIIERAVYNQIIYHLETHGLLDGRQHGFRCDHSTSSAIHTLVQDMYISNDRRETMMCVFIDYSKAFDTIDHEILCKKLMYYGLGTDMITWCKNYLSHRKQAVLNDNEQSDLLEVTYGVPQGSILGPLFFIIYVNDIMTLFGRDGPKILLYADDTVLYYSHTDISILGRTLNSGLERIWKWCMSNKLSVNTAKTKYISIDQYKRVNDTAEIKLGGVILERVSNYNYLGVILDDTLSFEKFLKEKCKKINMRIYQLGKMRKYIDNQIANTIYKQTIIPIFDYADFLVDSGPTYYRERLMTLHEKAVSIIDCNSHKRATIIELEKCYNLQPPRRRQVEHHSSIMYRLSRNRQTLDSYRPNINLRSRKKVKFKYRQRNMEKFLKSPLSRGIKLWDRIPLAIQRSVTKVKFKNQIRLLPDL